MKKIDIVMTQDRAHNCVDNVIAAIAKYFNKGYELIFWKNRNRQVLWIKAKLQSLI